jgi:hypothetical protein
MTDVAKCHFLPFEKSRFLPPNCPTLAKKAVIGGGGKNALRFFNG